MKMHRVLFSVIVSGLMVSGTRLGLSKTSENLRPSIPVASERILWRALNDIAGGFQIVWNSSAGDGTFQLQSAHFSAEGSVSSVTKVSGTLADERRWDVFASSAGLVTVCSVEAGRLMTRRYEGPSSLWKAAVAVAAPASGGAITSVVGLDDLQGGAFLVWAEETQGASVVKAQRLGAGGKPLWADGGVPVALGGAHQTQPNAVVDGQGGLTVAWKGIREEASTLRVQRFDSQGRQLWRPQGVMVTTAAGTLRQRIQLAAPGLGGVVVAWSQGVAGQNRAVFQHVNAKGERAWDPEGITMSVAAGEEWDPLVLGTGKGSTWIGWERTVDNLSLVAVVRRDPPAGAPWPAGDVALAPISANQGRLNIVDDGRDGLLAAWVDNRTNIGVYLQEVGATGKLLLGPYGLPVATNLHGPQRPQIVPLSGNQVAVAWLGDAGKQKALFTKVVPLTPR